MNFLVVYYSKFGNTRLLAKTLAETLTEGLDTDPGSQGAVRLLGAGELAASDLDGLDLLVMGAPTHKMNLPEDLRPLLERLPAKCLKGVRFAAFDTSYEMSWWLNRLTASKKLDKKLRKLGGDRLLPPETFLVEDREGPLREGELERARDWAAHLLDRLRP